jgi:uncharacterized lipoprotein YajG
MSAAAIRPRQRPAAAVTLALLAAILLLAACGDPGRSAAGIVAALDASGGQVTGFTLRTQDGATMTFEIGELETDGAAFPASHLAEHAVTLQPIAVGYRVQDGQNVVHRMVDAPWAAPTG